MTIIIDDSSVGKGEQKTNKLFFDQLDFSSCSIPSNVHALQWDGSSGEVEFNDGTLNQTITELPSWAVSCSDLWESAKYALDNPAPLTDEEKILNNKNKARELLFMSDWATLPDVNLSNQSEWITYRSLIRSIFLNPTVEVTFPTEPAVVWA